jgi:ceramide glucosyltransferase
VRVVVHEEAAGLNPKVNQLIALTREARHGVIAATDATIRVAPDWLTETVAALERPGVGLATHMPAGDGERRLGAAWDNQALVTFVSPNVAVAAALGMDQVVGKSLALRRSTLEAVGGWEPSQDVLGEDQLLGKALARLGLRSHVCPTPVRDVATERTLTAFWERHTRWAAIRFRLVRPGAYLEPLLNPTPFALAAAVVDPRRRRWLAASLLASAAYAHVCARLTRGHGFRPLHLALFGAQQLAFLAAWGRGAALRSVTWQGHRRRIGARTRLSLHDSERG